MFTFVSAIAAHACTVDEDCNLNGRCTSQGCRCLAAWRGPSCGELSVLPAARSAGLHASDSNTSSWGGAVTLDAQRGGYQMFAAEIVGGCGINAWETNSRIVRATAASLNEAFKVEEVIKPAFAHEPTLTRLPNGTWLLFSIGNRSSSPPPRTDCARGYTPSHGGGRFSGFVPVEAASSSSLAGPWTLRATIGNGDFNPSPLVLPNGTTLLMWRHLARVHMVRAPSYRGPFAFNGSDGACPNATSTDPGCRWWHLFNSTVDARGLEDPFVYTQPDGSDAGAPPQHTYHALFHDHVSFGGHAFSRDGVSWTYSDTPPYGNLLEFADGTSTRLQRRERPHLVFDAQGYIAALTTSAQPPPTAAKAPPAGFSNDYSFTSVQPVTPQPLHV